MIPLHMTEGSGTAVCPLGLVHYQHLGQTNDTSHFTYSAIQLS
ncbi:hypothetical protein ALQ79_200675 [Pseudomonas amygdali pv. lachrymans]|nr:hypothetical protein ALQ79_200675 [Pseudomonas amygdali pv. lachrymans]